MNESTKNTIGFWGYPNPDIINKYKKLYPDASWVDLDIDFGYPETKILPDAYCKIIKNIMNNAIFLRDSFIVILAPIGKDKCDSGWFAAKLLSDIGFDVVSSVFENFDHRKKIQISTSNLPLRKKVELITGAIISPVKEEFVECKPRFGFWGVPPNDLSILELFPDNTHLYGWTRCVEANVPADLDLEMYISSFLFLSIV